MDRHRLTQRKYFEHYCPDELTRTACVDNHMHIVEPYSYPIYDDLGTKIKSISEPHYYIVGEVVDKLMKYEDAEELGFQMVNVDKIIGKIHEYFLNEINNTDENFIPHYMLKYNKDICEIVRKGSI